ncbi:MAG: hypothetical protein KF893_04875 [Caldilineaceae bacterium]|nr:hypothetical protein [Caldilineaceae bacterium]
MKWIQDSLSRGKAAKEQQKVKLENEEAARRQAALTTQQRAVKIIERYAPIVQELMDQLATAGFPVSGPSDGFHLVHTTYITQDRDPQALYSEGFQHHADHQGTKYFCRSWWPFSNHTTGTQVVIIPLVNDSVEVRVVYGPYEHGTTQIISDPKKIVAKLKEVLSKEIERHA